MLRSMILALSATLAATAAQASGTLPSRADVAALFVKEVCYKLRVEITRLSDMTTLAPAEIPLCVEEPQYQATGDCAVRPDSPTAYNCSVGLADPTQHYVRVSTPGYQFAAYYGDETVASAYGQSYRLTLSQLISIQDVWSYRLTQILNVHRSELPTSFASLILPADNAPRVAVGGLTSQKQAGDPVVYNNASDMAQWPAIFSSVQAVGYDASGSEYGVHISARFDHATMANP